MRCSARVLSAAALASAALGTVASPAFADSSADIAPRSVGPGRMVTISVSCDAIGGTMPDLIEATSQGLEGGKASLNRVDTAVDSATGRSGTANGVVYSGTARIHPGAFADSESTSGGELVSGISGRCPVEPGGREKPQTALFTVSRDDSAQQGDQQKQDEQKQDQQGQQKQDQQGQKQQQDQQQGEKDKDQKQKQKQQDQQGQKQQQDLQQGEKGRDQQQEQEDQQQGQKQQGQKEQDQQQGSKEKENGMQPPTGAQHGVHAGEGGVFTDSVPALVAGGSLIAVAFGAAVHRMLRRASGDG